VLCLRCIILIGLLLQRFVPPTIIEWALLPHISLNDMTLDELRTHLLALTPAEKAEIVHLLVQSLGNTWPGIDKTPGVVGGDACIAGTRIPVLDLVQYRHLGASDAKILEAYPQLTATDLVQAWRYAEAHPEEIQQAIDQNEAA
jgi:uncharacterized protein (DUF433 family)